MREKSEMGIEEKTGKENYILFGLMDQPTYFDSKQIGLNIFNNDVVFYKNGEPNDVPILGYFVSDFTENEILGDKKRMVVERSKLDEYVKKYNGEFVVIKPEERSPEKLAKLGFISKLIERIEGSNKK